MVKKFINKNQSNVIVVGKIYWEDCRACIELKPAWIKMKKEIRKLYKNNPNVSYIFNEIKSGDTEQMLIDKINENYLSNSENKLAIQGGYPTIFKIKNNSLSYFEGSDRTKESLIKFYVDDKSGGNNTENELRMKEMTKSLDIAEKMNSNNTGNEKKNNSLFSKLRSFFGGNRTRKRRSDKKRKTQKKQR